MTAEVLILVASVLWLLMGLRFWLLVGRQNRWQRHLIAIAAAVGAGMIYILGSMILSLLRDEPLAADDIRVAPRVQMPEKKEP